MRLREISPDAYARDVLPQTAPLWAGRRSFEEYARQTLEATRGRYGRRHYQTIGLYGGSTRVSSFKRYERAVRNGSRSLRAVGFGAVFTPPEYRGRGYATLMLAMALDEARNQGWDLGFLFSDIRPQFYAALGFRELPSRGFSLRAAALAAARLPLARLTDDDWDAVAQAFEYTQRSRAAAFIRSSKTWDWIRMHARHAGEQAVRPSTNLVVRRGRNVRAYVLGARDLQRDAYIIEEFAFADESEAAAIPALLRAAAGDLRRIAGWLPPNGARDLLPRPSVRKRTRAILMMAPLSLEGGRLIDVISANSFGDFCWPTDHI